MVIDGGRYRAALASGAPDRRPMFTGIEGSEVTWSDASMEDVDALVFATGYRPDLDYLAPLQALDPSGLPPGTTAVSRW